MHDEHSNLTLFEIERQLTERRLLGRAGQLPSAEVVPAPDGIVARLAGRFPVGWAGALANGLTARNIGIARGFASRQAEGRWTAEFRLRPALGASYEGLDIVALAATIATEHTPLPLALDTFYIDGSPDSGGALLLEVRGPDRLGFLAGLLDRLAFVSLFPEEMTIETCGGTAVDSFLLRGTAGAVPTAETQRVLSEILSDLLVR